MRIIKGKNEITIFLRPLSPEKEKEKEKENIDINACLKEENEKIRISALTKEKVLASVSHDMRTPLNGIIYYLKSAQNVENGLLRNQKLKYALMNANLLMFLVNDLLEFTVNNSDKKMSLKLTKFPLQSMLEDVLDFMKIESENKNIQLLLNIKCSQGLTLINDEGRLKRVIINLLTNALKFTIKGCVILKITQLNEIDHNLLKIEVIDTGLGIKPEFLPKLMQPFATFDDSEHKVNNNGIGLGLYICKTIVQLLGPNKQLYIQSKLGKGSKFGFLSYIINDGENISNIKDPTSFFNDDLEDYFEENIFESDMYETQIKTKNISNKAFYNKKKSMSINSLTSRTVKSKSFKSNPIKINNDGTMNSDAICLNSSGNYKPIYNVLLCDDNGFNLLILEDILDSLNEWNFDIHKASNGQAAFEMFCEKNAPWSDFEDRFHIIFMDFEMPIMSGIQATKNIREKICKEGFHNVRIIGCSGDGSMYNCEEKIKELLMDDVYGKPINCEQVLSCIKKFLK